MTTNSPIRLAIAGGHGQIALHLERLLAAAGHRSTALIRNPDHADDVRAAGADPVILDLEKANVDELAATLTGHDAVVFAAGAGPSSSPERKATVDRDGAILLADAATLAGIQRYVMISAMSADEGDPESDDIFQIYLVAKGDADRAVRESGLDWTIVRPGMLTNDGPTGLVDVGDAVERGAISRADVAAVLVAAVEDDATIGTTFEVVSGSTPIKDAVNSLG